MRVLELYTQKPYELARPNESCAVSTQSDRCHPEITMRASMPKPRRRKVEQVDDGTRPVRLIGEYTRSIVARDSEAGAGDGRVEVEGSWPEVRFTPKRPRPASHDSAGADYGIAAASKYARDNLTDDDEKNTILRLATGHPFGPWNDVVDTVDVQYAPMPLLALVDGRKNVHPPSCAWWSNVLEHALVEIKKKIIADQPSYEHIAVFPGKIFGLYIAGGAVAAYVNGGESSTGDLDIFINMHNDYSATAREYIFGIVVRCMCDAMIDAVDTSVMCQGNMNVARLCAEKGTRRIDIMCKKADKDSEDLSDFLDTFDVWPTRIAINPYANTLHVRYADRISTEFKPERVRKYEERGYTINKTVIPRSAECMPDGYADSPAKIDDEGAGLFCCGHAKGTWTHRPTNYYDGPDGGEKRGIVRDEYAGLLFGIFTQPNAEIRHYAHDVYDNVMGPVERKLVPVVDDTPRICVECLYAANKNKYRLVDVTGINMRMFVHDLWEAAENTVAAKNVALMHGRSYYEHKKVADDIAECIKAKKHLRYDYLFGRPLKVDIPFVSGRECLVNARLYDRDAGQGTMYKIAQKLRTGMH